MAKLPWTEEEITALHRLVQIERATNKHFRKIFPYRTLDSVNNKLTSLRAQDPERWIPQARVREIQWELLDDLEREASSCDESDSLETPTSAVGTV